MCIKPFLRKAVAVMLIGFLSAQYAVADTDKQVPPSGNNGWWQNYTSNLVALGASAAATFLVHLRLPGLTGRQLGLLGTVSTVGMIAATNLSHFYPDLFGYKTTIWEDYQAAKLEADKGRHDIDVEVQGCKERGDCKTTPVQSLAAVSNMSVLMDQANNQLALQAEKLTATHAHIDRVNNRVNQLHNDMQKNDKKAMRGIAAVAAIGNTVFPSAPGKTVVGAGVAGYEGSQAVAISLSHRPQRLDQMSFQGGIGASNGGKPVMRIGASYEF